MTLLFTVRHAATGWSEQGLYAGSRDVPLSAQGRAQATEAGAALAAEQIDVVLSSPMRRAVETAELLRPEQEIVILPGAQERCFGELEGRSWEDVLDWEPPIMLIEVGGDQHTVNPPGGEPFEDVFARARRCASFITHEYSGKTVLLVAHGVFLTMFHGHLLGRSCIESLTIHPQNLELATFDLREGRPATLVSTRHLAEQSGLGF